MCEEEIKPHEFVSLILISKEFGCNFLKITYMGTNLHPERKVLNHQVAKHGHNCFLNCFLIDFFKIRPGYPGKKIPAGSAYRRN